MDRDVGHMDAELVTILRSLSGKLSVTIEGALSTTTTGDGGHIVQVPASGATITAYGGGGAALNVRGNNTRDIHSAHPQLPILVRPGDSFILAGVANQRGDRGSYPFAAPGRSDCDEMHPVVFVPYAVGPGMLRPPAIGNDSLTRFLRTYGPIYESAVSTGHLPSAVDVDALGVDWSAWGATMPTLNYLTELLSPFSGDCYDGWSTDTRTPDRAHPGYGAYVASITSQAGIQLCSTAPASVKRPLAIAVVQRALDLAGAFADGRDNSHPANGHMLGRLGLILMGAHILGIPEVRSIIGHRFVEDVMFANDPWWDGGWLYGWRGTISQAGMVAHPPSTWGDANDASHLTFAWAMRSYLGQAAGASIGTVLAAKLMGRESELGRGLCGFVEQWMAGPRPEVKAQLDAAGVTLPWATSYSVGRGAGFAEAAWKRHAPSS